MTVADIIMVYVGATVAGYLCGKVWGFFERFAQGE